MKDGPYESWFQGSRQRMATGQYVNGRKSGPWTIWNEWDLRQEGSFDGENQTGMWSTFYQDGTLESQGSYVSGKRDGSWTFFDSTGAVRGVNKLKNGTGHWISWHQAGGKKAEGDLLDDERSGRWVFWFPSGQQMLEGSYSHDLRQGEWTQWAENGVKGEVSHYVDDQLDGLSTTWDTDTGLKQVEGTYKKDERVGVWSWFDADGLVMEQVTFDDAGKAISKRRKAELADERRKQAAELEAAQAKRDAEARMARRETQRADFQARRARVVKTKKGAAVVSKAEKIVKSMCGLVEEKVAIVRKFEDDCPLRESGSSERSCDASRMEAFAAADREIDLKISAERRRLEPLAGEVAADPTTAEEYPAFLEAAIDCYCPDPETGAAPLCK